VVADIGAGTGYFSFRLSQKVPKGRVLAVDIQPEMLSIMRDRIAAGAAENVVPVLGAFDDPNLPAGAVDAVLMVDAYHEFSHPWEMMQGIVTGLRSGGRVFLVEYRGEDPAVLIKPLHKMTEAQARREMEAVGLVWEETLDVLPTQHLMVFRKP
jgi:ubiquinone/menaquinone biosynthesis C-methylase UbiE